MDSGAAKFYFIQAVGVGLAENGRIVHFLIYRTNSRTPFGIHKADIVQIDKITRSSGAPVNLKTGRTQLSGCFPGHRYAI